MEKRAFALITMMSIALMLVGLAPALAGGPPCPRPVMCPTPVCVPQPVPVLVPQPMCAPPPCGPVACGPPPCPPRRCRPNPLATLCKGAVSLVAGVIALPFRILDGLLCPNPCGYACAPPRRLACPPPMCGPVACGPAPMMMGGPGFCPPMYGYGRPPVAPMGFGRGASPRMVPFAKKESLQTKLVADSAEGMFGAYW